MPLTKEQAIENVKTAKKELKNLLHENGLKMESYGKAHSYHVIKELLLTIKHGGSAIGSFGIFQDLEEVE